MPGLVTAVEGDAAVERDACDAGCPSFDGCRSLHRTPSPPAFYRGSVNINVIYSMLPNFAILLPVSEWLVFT